MKMLELTKLPAKLFVVLAFGALTAAPQALSAAHAQSAQLTAPAHPRLAAYSDQINWITNPNEMVSALETAREEGRPILVVFHADWCPYCVQMDTETFQDSDVVDLSQQFTCLRVDTDTPFGAALERKLGITDIPTTLLYHGSQFQKITGYTDSVTFADDLRAIL